MQETADATKFLHLNKETCFDVFKRSSSDETYTKGHKREKHKIPYLFKNWHLLF